MPRRSWIASAFRQNLKHASGSTIGPCERDLPPGLEAAAEAACSRAVTAAPPPRLIPDAACAAARRHGTAVPISVSRKREQTEHLGLYCAKEQGLVHEDPHRRCRHCPRTHRSTDVVRDVLRPSRLDDVETTGSFDAPFGSRFDRDPSTCPQSSAAEGNANQQNFPVKQYGQTAGGNRC